MTNQEKIKALDLIFEKKVDIVLVRNTAQYPQLGYKHYQRNCLFYGKNKELTEEEYDFMVKVAKHYGWL